MTEPADIRVEETRLVQIRDEALELARISPITKAKLKVLEKAESDLNKFRDSLNNAPGEVFANLKEVLVYLDPDWKISKSTLYEHKYEGKIRPGTDGKYYRTAVMEYARQHLQRKDGSSSDEKASLQEQRLLEEIRRIASDANLRELKYKERQGELMPREFVEVELASRVSDLRTHLDASARSAAGRIIKLVGGDPQKAPELISFMLGLNRKMMDNYSRPIQGPEDEEL